MYVKTKDRHIYVYYNTALLSMFWQLYFVGSASSFYFLYDFCLHGNVNSQMAYFIRFLPLFVAIITCAIVLCFRSATAQINMVVSPVLCKTGFGDFSFPSSGHGWYVKY